jgi:5,10-methenyltetrahydrofolate synthetase
MAGFSKWRAEKKCHVSAELEKDYPSGYASPACFMHEVDPVYMGLTRSVDAVAAWRKDIRRNLIDRRAGIGAVERERQTSLILGHLDRLLPDVADRNISVYWPFLGEADLRGWMASATAAGATCLLPVVTEKRRPLIFRSWRVGEELAQGILNIPVPLNGEERRPDVVIAPVVGFDDQCFRLGFGGGYFDRTLASLAPRPLVIGVGFEFQKITSIHPQDHDIPMDIIVTDSGVISRADAGI